jgi:hypothetical protein
MEGVFMEDAIRFDMRSANPTVGDDPDLAQLHDRWVERQVIRGLMGAGENETPNEVELPPFDLEAIRPRAIGMRRLCALANNKLDAKIEATLGNATEPVLLYQGITPFHPAGEVPRGIWGMGYQLEIVGNADTIDWQPNTQLLEVAKIDQEIAVGLAAGGGMGVGRAEDTQVIPGVDLPGAHIRATTDQRFKLSISFIFNLLRVQAGPVGAGGIRWNFYRQDQRLDGFQPLLQTIMVPKDTRSLNVRITTWVRGRARWLGLGTARTWTPPAREFEISLSGLGGG